MTLNLPTVLADRPSDEVALELNREEQIAVAKWLEFAIDDVSRQGKALVDRYKAQKVIHKKQMKQREFLAELRGYDVILGYLKAMRLVVEQSLTEQHDGKPN